MPENVDLIRQWNFSRTLCNVQMTERTLEIIIKVQLKTDDMQSGFTYGETLSAIFIDLQGLFSAKDKTLSWPSKGIQNNAYISGLEV